MEDNTLNLTFNDQKQVLIRLMKYTLPFRKTLLAGVVMLIISTVAGVATPYAVMIFIDEYLTPGLFPESDITWLIIIFFLVQAVGAVTTYMQIYLFQYLAFRVIQQLRIDAFSKIGRLGMRYFDKVPGGSVVSRLTNDTEAIV